MRIIVIGLLLAVTMAGCAQPQDGDKVATAGGPDSQAVSTTKPPLDEEAPLQYSKCMRENGLPDFPDPKPDDKGGFDLSLPDGIDKAKLQEAQGKCKQLIPNGGEPRKPSPEKIEGARKKSQCMRENGFPDFPDPDENGGLRIEAGPKLDPRDPKFQEAEKKCAQFLPDGGSVDRKDG